MDLLQHHKLASQKQTRRRIYRAGIVAVFFIGIGFGVFMAYWQPTAASFRMIFIWPMILCFVWWAVFKRLALKTEAMEQGVMQLSADSRAVATAKRIDRIKSEGGFDRWAHP